MPEIKNTATEQSLVGSLVAWTWMRKESMSLKYVAMGASQTEM